jgi:hypothetical protein
MTVLLSSRCQSLERRVNREKEIIMSKFLQNSRTKTVLFGSVALLALISVAPVAPASAQGVPAGLLRLDSTRPSNDIAQLPDEQRSKVRASYARSRKIQHQQ